MHQTTIPYLKNKSINKYLERLSEILIANNLGEHNILIVGGAAMALRSRYSGRATVDIDICLREQNRLYDCCLQVAKEYSIPTDWVNADVMHSESFSYRLFENAVPYKVYNNILAVYIASDIDLLCMKLVSFRPKDMKDINKLIKTLLKNGITYEEVENRFNYLYGSLYLLNRKSGRFLYHEMKK